MKDKKNVGAEAVEKVEVENRSDGAYCNKLKECSERLLRVTADFQNFKKRTEKERAGWGIVSQAAVLRLFLPLIDDIDLAMLAAEASETTDSDREWMEGFRLIQKKFNKILQDQGVEEIDCTVPFDPHFHEALVSVESEKHDSGAIVEVLRKGYKFKDVVLRHARVSVCK
ncbi:nucleotide exchange factor GrpE [Candidatus Dependentiae bacterium]